jgi:hypothetical protein
VGLNGQTKFFWLEKIIYEEAAVGRLCIFEKSPRSLRMGRKRKGTLDTLDIFEKNCLMVGKVIGMALFC